MLTQETTDQGFPYLFINNQNAIAKVSLQGGHIFHYQQKGKSPLLWLSQKSNFTSGKAIRGGIPICWPWFGKHPTDAKLPQHGFARTSLFRLASVKETDTSSTEILLELNSDAGSFRLWPHRFHLQLRIVIASSLSLKLTTHNLDSAPFSISSALHSYFAVSHIDKVSVQGLDQLPFLNFLNQKRSIQQGQLRIHMETDRCYQNVKAPLSLHDIERTIHINSTGSRSCVIWNPWLEKSRQMADMTQDAYLKMLCVETANAFQDTRTLESETKHSLQVKIS